MQLTAEAFGRLFLECRSSFENIAFSYINDSDAAKDIVTDSFMYLWEHRETLEGEDNIKGYLYMCVRARCISHLRKQQTLLKAKNELSDEARWRIETSLGVLSDSGLSDRLYREEILEIFNKELVRMPRGRDDIYANCGKIQCIPPQSHLGNPACPQTPPPLPQRLSLQIKTPCRETDAY